jgi:uncharacterized tellurite resistance protein B-like protein
MSLLSRFLGIGDNADDDEPESMRRIATELEDLEPERARHLAAFAYILARVAHADMKVDASEVAEMERVLVSQGELPETAARLAVQIAVHQAVATGATDDYLVTREFRRMTEKPERVRLMRCLLAVAAADDRIDSEETNELLAIGEELGFTRPEVFGLRLEYRDKLAELQKLDGER